MKKVVVALSGGVDSSVAAALLVKEGYDVVGVTVRLWSEPGCEHENRCCTPETRILARQLAEQLGIPFQVIDAAQIFRSQVVQPFLDGYDRGDTPNPCIFCNRYIKWGFLLDYSRSIGADTIATGHYARICTSPHGKLELWKGVDESKDQSYFLSLLNQDHLAHTIFPLAQYQKTDVRRLAHEWNLPAADQPESQDLCFLGNRDTRSFLMDYIPQAVHPGIIRNRQGQIIGEHQGLAFYTVGQRKGLPSASRPIYVLEKDVTQNQLIVGYLEDLGKAEMVVMGINWISGEAPAADFSAEVKIRYKATPVPARVISQMDGSLRVFLDQPLRDITAGQMAVFYQGDMVLGGGIIG
ncbi:MAG: tRNA 2-thiouridine(34) synthase MnmA [Chloroflexi bacterium]|nr:tRNA 2-thiouridine(34) synthase MnmA [Chloroflexota bacterium]